MVNNMLQSKEVVFCIIALHIGQNGNDNPLYVAAKKFELLQHVVDQYILRRFLPKTPTNLSCIHSFDGFFVVPPQNDINNINALCFIFDFGRIIFLELPNLDKPEPKRDLV